jgi:hypothetical protein
VRSLQRLPVASLDESAAVVACCEGEHDQAARQPGQWHHQAAADRPTSGLQVVDAAGLGLSLPREMVQSALNAFTIRLPEVYPLGIRADSVQITDDGVTEHYSR